MLGGGFYNPDPLILDALGGITAIQYQGITLVHEALHAYTGMSDPALAEKLGLGQGLSQADASAAITKYLKNNCDLKAMQ